MPSVLERYDEGCDEVGARLPSPRGATGRGCARRDPNLGTPRPNPRTPATQLGSLDLGRTSTLRLRTTPRDAIRRGRARRDHAEPRHENARSHNTAPVRYRERAERLHRADAAPRLRGARMPVRTLTPFCIQQSDSAGVRSDRVPRARRAHPSARQSVSACGASGRVEVHRISAEHDFGRDIIREKGARRATLAQSIRAGAGAESARSRYAALALRAPRKKGINFDQLDEGIGMRA